MHRYVVISLLMVCTALVALGVGFLAGLSFGAMNSRTDLCYDQTSGRYISDAKTRQMLCK